MIKIDDDIIILKHEVLTHVAKLAYEDRLTDENISKIPFEIIPSQKAHFRCCVYKEREIITQRTRLAMGKMPINSDKKGIITVIESACEGCPINRYTVTENCQKCLAKKCQKACHFGAITMTGRGAYIDPTKCKECGKCAEACPYNAIADLVRPCKRSCPVNAININENRIADIDEEKCISCGACMKACPFGAISDVSYMNAVISEIKSGKKVYAVIAPALEGQFGIDCTMGKLKTAVKSLGFSDVLEVSLGADATTVTEAKELIEVSKNGEQMTTSCCPAFVNMIRKHYPKVLDKVSSAVSPMVATARLIKSKHPDALVVFVGPCVAKKTEVVEDGADYMLTTEEICAMFDAKGVNVAECEESKQDGSIYGKKFASNGGVTNAVLKAIEEITGETPDISAQRCNGAAECKKALTLLANGRLPETIIEGMVCEGGCMKGPANIQNDRIYAQARNKLLAQSDDRGILENFNNAGFGEVNLHRKEFEK